MVEIAKLRSPPSFSAYDVRSFTGQSGHGVSSSERCGGGSPSSSICVTDAAASRCALATQSAPVSPPPITITCLPRALIVAVAVPATSRFRAVEVLHREVHAAELAAGHAQVARDARAGGEHDGVEALAQLGRVDVPADVDAEAKLDALVGELREASLDDVLLDLEVGDRRSGARPPPASSRSNTVTECPARFSCCAHASPAGPDPTTATLRPLRLAGGSANDPALFPRARHDRELDLLDRDGVALVDLEHARGLARRRAEPPGELGEVVRAVELVDRLAEAVAVDEVVPVGDEVPERAAVMAERHAALHAARALLLQLDERQRAHELAVVADALARNALGRIRAGELLEAADLAHLAPLPFRSRA